MYGWNISETLGLAYDIKKDNNFRAAPIIKRNEENGRFYAPTVKGDPFPFCYLKST